MVKGLSVAGSDTDILYLSSKWRVLNVEAIK